MPPAICISLTNIAFFSQMLAQAIEKGMNEESAFYARCRGLSERRIMFFHAFPQAITELLPSFMQVVGLTLAGAIIVERIFSLPGLGYLIIESVLNRDPPMIHASIVYLAFAIAVFNVLADLLQRILPGGSNIKKVSNHEKTKQIDPCLAFLM